MLEEFSLEFMREIQGQYSEYRENALLSEFFSFFLAFNDYIQKFQVHNFIINFFIFII